MKRKYGGGAKTSKKGRRLFGSARKPGFKGKPLRGPKVFSLTRVTSTNYQQNYGIMLATDSSGIPKFQAQSVQSDIMTMNFTLNGVNIYIGGQGSLLTAPTYVAPLPGISDCQALFDSYFIDYIEIMALTSFTDNSVTGGTIASQLPYVVHCFDNDDSLSNNATTIMQKTGAKYTQFTGVGMKRIGTIRPSQAIQLYGSSTTTGYAPKRGFVDMASASVPHYGYKFALDNTTTTYNVNSNIASINFIFKYHMKFKYTL